LRLTLLPDATMANCTLARQLISEKDSHSSAGLLLATAHRLPVKLEYYEASRSELKARIRKNNLRRDSGEDISSSVWIEGRSTTASLREALRAGVRYQRRAFCSWTRLPFSVGRFI
jgi:hypothetical protein